MAEMEVDSLEYLSKAFKGLSDEKQDYVLKTAKSLLEVQDKDVYPTFPEKTVPHSGIVGDFMQI
jgi:succinate dehydrogenase flavin-adding protein (antitoxin of CptAB toxin-antitoxin module)